MVETATPAAFANLIDYSPTNVRAFEVMRPERLPFMPTAPANGAEALLINIAWWPEDGVPREQIAAQLQERWLKG